MREIADIAEKLERVYLFAGLSPEQRARIFESVHRVQLEPGEPLFHHGDAASRFYWLNTGLVKLTRLSPDGEEKVVELIQPNQTFGEAIMFMDRRVFPVNAEAIEASDVVGFDSRTFRDLLRASSDTCFALLANLSQRLRHIVDEIDRLTLQNATARVAAYLLDQADAEGHLELSTPKHLLASRLSIQPETLSRIFARLGKEGLISVKGPSIQLHDIEAIRSYVSNAAY